MTVTRLLGINDTHSEGGGMSDSDSTSSNNLNAHIKGFLVWYFLGGASLLALVQVGERATFDEYWRSFGSLLNSPDHFLVLYLSCLFILSLLAVFHFCILAISKANRSVHRLVLTFAKWGKGVTCFTIFVVVFIFGMEKLEAHNKKLLESIGEHSNSDEDVLRDNQAKASKNTNNINSRSKSKNEISNILVIHTKESDDQFSDVVVDEKLIGLLEKEFREGMLKGQAQQLKNRGFSDSALPKVTNSRLSTIDNLGVPVGVATVWLKSKTSDGEMQSKYIIAAGVIGDTLHRIVCSQLTGNEILLLVNPKCNTKLREVFLREHKPSLTSLKEAAMGSNVIAQFELGEKYRLGDSVAIDYKESFRWYLMAAELGHPKSVTMVADGYYTGVGVERDLVEAVKWLEQATKYGDVGAKEKLALLYISGQGTIKDISEAKILLNEAAKSGSMSAQIHLAKIYTDETRSSYTELGRSSTRTAYMWSNIAAASGSEEAKKIREKLEARMINSEVVKAQRMSKRCIESDYRVCEEIRSGGARAF